MADGQTSYLHIGIDGSGAQTGARVVQRSLQDITDASNNTQSSMMKMKEVLFGIAGAAVGVYGIATAIQAIGNYAKESLNYLGLIETSTLGIASSFLVSGQYIDSSTKKALEGQEALKAAQAESARTIEQLRYANLQTIATLDELIVAYQTTLPVAMSRGFDKKMVMEFTKSMVQAAGAIGLPFNQMAEETRSLLMGTINPRNTRIATVLGLTNADVNQFKGDAQGLFDFLQKRLEGFRIAGEASMQTWKGLWSNVKDVSQQISAEMFKPAFDAIKSSLSNFMKDAIIIDPKNETYKLSENIMRGVEAIKTLVSITYEAGKALLAYVIIYKGGAVIETITAWVSAKAKLISTEYQLQAAEESGNAVRLGGIEQQKAMAVAAYDAATANLALVEATIASTEANIGKLQSNIAMMTSEQELHAIHMLVLSDELALTSVKARSAELALADITSTRMQQEAKLSYVAAMDAEKVAMELTIQEERALAVAREESKYYHISIPMLLKQEEAAQLQVNVATNAATLAQERLNIAMGQAATLGKEKQVMNALLVSEEKTLAATKDAHTLAQERLNGAIIQGDIANKATTASFLTMGTAMNALMALWVGWEIGSWLNKFQWVREAGVIMVYGLIGAFDLLIASAEFTVASIKDIFTLGFAGATSKVMEETKNKFGELKKNFQEQYADVGRSPSAAKSNDPNAEYLANKKKEEEKNATKNAIEHFKNMLEIQKQYNENKLNLAKAVGEQELAIIKGNHDLGMTTTWDYLNQKRKVEMSEAEAAIARARQNLNDIKPTIGMMAQDTPHKTPEDEIKIQREMEKLTKDRVKAEGELAVAQIKRGTVEQEANIREQLELKKLQDQFLDYYSSRLEMEGDLIKAIDLKNEREMKSVEMMRLQLMAQEEMKNPNDPRFAGSSMALEDKLAVMDHNRTLKQKELNDLVSSYNAKVTEGLGLQLQVQGYTAEEVKLLTQKQVQNDAVYALELKIATEINPQKKAELQLELDNLRLKNELENKYYDINLQILDLKKQQSGAETALRVLEANGVAGLEEYKRILGEVVLQEKYLEQKKQMQESLEQAKLASNQQLVPLMEEAIRLLDDDYNMRNSSVDAQERLNEALGITAKKQKDVTDNAAKGIRDTLQAAKTLGDAVNAPFNPNGRMSNSFSLGQGVNTIGNTHMLGDNNTVGVGGIAYSPGMGGSSPVVAPYHMNENLVQTANGLQWVTRGMEKNLAGFGMSVEDYNAKIEAQKKAVEDAAKALHDFLVKLSEFYMGLGDRLLAISGGSDAAEVMKKQVQQAKEMTQAQLDGMDTVMLAQVQQLEMQKLLADQQVAIAQKAYDAAKALLGSAKTTLEKYISEFTSKIQSTLTASNSALNAIIAMISQLNGGTLSTLSPEQKYEKTKQDYIATANLALTGDSHALEALSSMAEKFLEASRGYNASGSAYVSDFNGVQSDLAVAEEIARAQKTIAEQQLAALTAMLAILNGDNTQGPLDAQYQKLILLDSASGNLQNAISGTTSAVGATTTATGSLTAAVGGTTSAVGGTNTAIGTVNTNLGTQGVVGSVNSVISALNGSAGTLSAVQAITAALGTTSGATSTVAGAIGTNLTSASGIGKTMAYYKLAFDTERAAGGVLKNASDKSTAIAASAATLAGIAYSKAGEAASAATSIVTGVNNARVRWVENHTAYYNDPVLGYTYRTVQRYIYNDGFAKGGAYPGGSAMMGEEGPELVDSTPGYVYRADETKALFDMAHRGVTGGTSDEEIALLREQNRHLEALVRVSSKGFSIIADQGLENNKQTRQIANSTQLTKARN